MTASPASSAEVVCVGDELLSGHVRDTNATWLGVHLAEIGVRLSRVTVVSDDVAAITDAIAAAASRVDLVVVTGGLGPTSDDVTREALAALLGSGLARDASVVATLQERAFRRGREVHPDSLRMADVPVGAQVLENPAGSAPALRIRLGTCEIVAMPGVPSEAEVCARLHVLAGRTVGVVATRSLVVALVGETQVAAALARVGLPGGGRLAYLPSATYVEVRVTVEAPSAERAASELDPLITSFRDALATAGIAVEDLPPAPALVRLLGARGETLAVAESLTGGALSGALVDVAGASAVLRGAIVAYATALKGELLGVDPELLSDRGPVDPEVAAAMAEGVRRRCDTTWALSTTGVAGPDPQDGHPVGEVHIGIVGPGVARTLSLTLSGSREAIREATVVHALVALHREINRSPN